MLEIFLKGKRRNLLIDPPFQVRLIAYATSIGVLISAILFAANRYFFRMFEAQGLAIGLPPDHILFRFLAEQQRTMNIIYGITALAAVLIIVIAWMVISHKIAGPIYHVKKCITENLAGNEVKEIHLRKGDFFLELADTVNLLLHRIGK